MNKPLVVIIALVLLVLLLLFSATYPVAFHEVAIKRTFGQSTPESVITTPGLQFKLPVFAEQVTHYDTRLQLIETPLETVPTRDGQQVVVRAFLLWQVETEDDGVYRFDTRYRSLENARDSIGDRFKTAVSAGLSRYAFEDLIGPESRLEAAEQAILDDLSPLAANGIRPVSVGISQMLLPPRTTQAVLARMEATRKTLAESEHFKGNAEAERIESESRTIAEKILTFAQQRAEDIRAEGNEEASRYFEMMAQDEELAIFLAYLDAFEASLSRHSTLILEADHAPWHLSRLSSAVDSRGIPQPNGALPRVAAVNPPNADNAEEEQDQEEEASESARADEPDEDAGADAGDETGGSLAERGN